MLRRFNFVLWAASMLLAAVAVVTTVVGIFVGVSMLKITFTLIAAAVGLILATNWWRRYLVRKVRWVEGTVTFAALSPVRWAKMANTSNAESSSILRRASPG